MKKLVLTITVVLLIGLSACQQERVLISEKHIPVYDTTEKGKEHFAWADKMNALLDSIGQIPVYKKGMTYSDSLFNLLKDEKLHINKYYDLILVDWYIQEFSPLEIAVGVYNNQKKKSLAKGKQEIFLSHTEVIKEYK